jgi:hypothetical protein
MRTTVWLVSVRAGAQRKDIFLKTKDEETPQDTYRRVKTFVNKVKEQVGNRATVDLISRTVAFKPKGQRPHKSWYWCPYCNQWRVFLYDEYFDRNCCNICGISDNDFYVKKYNGIWERELREGKVKL